MGRRGTPLATSRTPRKKAATPAAATDHSHDHGPAHAAEDGCCAHGHCHDPAHDHTHAHAGDADCCGHTHSQGPRRIYVYSPAGAVRDKAGFKRAVRRLEALGHQVEIDADALASHQRFAGDDATRLAAIHRAAASGADLVLPTRGGYGLTRILPGIQYKALAKAIEGGTRFVGLSDFTALSLALLAQTGATTWAGPLLIHDFGLPDAQGGVDDIMLDCFNDLLCGQGEGAGWQMPRIGLLPDGKPAVEDFYISGDATLWGGNLAVLVSLLGTPYFPKIQGGVLFLEDVGEHPYRIERMLTQLLHAGVLAQQKAIIFGQFTEFKLHAHDKGFKLQTVIDWLRSQLPCPVLQGLPYGHVPTKVLLPVGAPVSLSVEGRDALIYWGHTH
ncbi:LD-carboxypeptidase [Delftia sp. PS-11]|uniref:LD-carboxypeptidase n=1 Tax=Delftia sp. PS-11 TaxID=2767222 RepID=UPI003AB5B550